MSKALGIKMTHVPYRGGAPMTTDLIAGVIPVGIDVITAFVPYFKSGQIKPLAVTSAQRSPLAPDVPTVVEIGHGRLVLDNFFGLIGPGEDAGRPGRAPQRRDQRGAGDARHQEAPARARRDDDARERRPTSRPSCATR